MLFAHETEEQAVRMEALFQQVESGEIAGAEAAQRLFAVDPRSTLAWLLLAGDRLAAGDTAAAEAALWDGIKAHPAERSLYLKLGEIRYERDPQDILSSRLMALATWKLAFLTVIPDHVADELRENDPDSLEDFNNPKTYESIARDFERYCKPSCETPEVRDLLLPYRLLNDLQRQAPVAVECRLVREIAANAARCAPVLQAALMDWARYREMLSPPALQIAAALLGEIAPAEIAATGVLPDLLELSQFGSRTASLHAHWAIWRIGQRFPAESLAAFRAAIPEAALALRCSLADHIRMLPETVKREPALSDLLKGFSALAAEPGASYLLAAVADALGPTAQIRHLLARYPHLQPDTLPDDAPFVPDLVRKGIPHLDIKAVCIQRALMGPPREDGGVPSSGQAARAKPGRNEPCWCGSGAKYKKCHLASDQASQPSGASAMDEIETTQLRLFRTLLHEGYQRRSRAEYVEATRLYFGQHPSEIDPKSGLITCFYEWFVHDFRPGGTGPTAVEDYLASRGPRLTARERALLESWRQSRLAFWEVRSVDGAGAELRDPFTGEVVFVDDASLLFPLAPGNHLIGRIVEFEGRRSINRAMVLGWAQFPVMARVIEEDSRAMGQSPAEYIRANAHRWYRLALEICANPAAFGVEDGIDAASVR